MVPAVRLVVFFFCILPLTSGFEQSTRTRLTDEEFRALIQNRAHRYRYRHHRQRSTTKCPYLTSYVPFFGRYTYDHTRRPNFSTTFNPYVDYNMPNFPFHLYETNPYVKDVFNISFGSTTPYTTTENIFILYDDILLKKLYNHRARLFNEYDRYFPILFKRAWKYSVGALFYDNCDSRNHYYFPKTNLTRSDAIYAFYEFLKKVRQSLKEVLSWHFHQIPDHSSDIVFTQEKSINDMRHGFYTIENFISYDSNDINEIWDREHDNSSARYRHHIAHVNQKLQETIFPFVEKRYFNFLKNFKYPAAKDEAILDRYQIGSYLYKLCYKVVREIRTEPFFQFPTELPVVNYTSEELDIISKYQKAKVKAPQCETCEEREMIRNKKKNRI
ncbi:hypothetical protein M8J75_013034 [Diaphorina citri]|nr:hypothetical protein M8J75_013034 [Diaphorina citri]KAI5728600.1 hypothetical protein M8J77_018449 [Diaphorina citri]